MSDSDQSDNNPFSLSNKSLFSLEEQREKLEENEMTFDTQEEKQISQTGTKAFLDSSFSNLNKTFFLLTVGLILFGVLTRLFYIQIFQSQTYKAQARENKQRTIPIPSERGLIFDRNGVKLTENIPKFSLAISPQDLPIKQKQRDKIIDKLSSLTDKSTKKIRKQLKKYTSYDVESIVIKENLDYESALKLQITTSELPGVRLQRGSKRLYILSPNKQESKKSTSSKKIKSLSHILGYLGKISQKEYKNLSSQGYLPSGYIGKDGLEKQYESQLRGKYGQRVIEVNARGEKRKLISETSPTPGKHLNLALDIDIQKKLENLLDKYLKKKEKSKAAAVAMDPATGKIRGLVSLPSFNNNNFSAGISNEKYQSYLNNPDRPLFNRAVAGEYPPGSTIKPFIAAAALEENIVDKSTTINSTGGIEVGKWFFPDWQASGHGITNVTKAIARSVNTYFYYISGGYEDFEGMGLEVINKYLTKFNLNQKIGIDLPSESSGFLPTKEWKQKNKGTQWYIGDTYNLSIGQGNLLSTPLQITNSIASIANGGKLYKPSLVDSIKNPVTEESIKQNSKLIRKDFISNRTTAIIQEGMRECVVYGSCRRLDQLELAVAGKTGTAQWNKKKKPHSWFTSFAPYQDPEIVLTILVEAGGGGDETAVPIAYDFYKWWNKNYN